MSDDLIKRLRVGSIWGQSVLDTLANWKLERQDAANRIEQLETERDLLRAQVDALIEAGNNLRSFANLFTDEAPQIAVYEWDWANGNTDAD